MTEEEIEERGRKYTEALAKSFKTTFDDVFEKNEDFQKQEPVVQEMIKSIVFYNIGRHYGGFDK